LFLGKVSSGFDHSSVGFGSKKEVSADSCYLREHISAAGKALAQGVPMLGYFAWSFLDNYEWAQGYSKRFGIVYVDFATQRRIVKDSGRWYGDFIVEQRKRR
jgi:beta-glucosidase